MTSRTPPSTMAETVPSLAQSAKFESERSVAGTEAMEAEIKGDQSSEENTVTGARTSCVLPASVPISLAEGSQNNGQVQSQDIAAIHRNESAQSNDNAEILRKPLPPSDDVVAEMKECELGAKIDYANVVSAPTINESSSSAASNIAANDHNSKDLSEAKDADNSEMSDSQPILMAAQVAAIKNNANKDEENDMNENNEVPPASKNLNNEVAAGHENVAALHSTSNCDNNSVNLAVSANAINVSNPHPICNTHLPENDLDFINNFKAERRGSGYLLLAAAATERAESRENAIRQAALQLTEQQGHQTMSGQQLDYTSGQIAIQPPMYASTYSSANSHPEVDQQLRDQVYMVAARMSQQQTKIEGHQLEPSYLHQVHQEQTQAQEEQPPEESDLQQTNNLSFLPPLSLPLQSHLGLAQSIPTPNSNNNTKNMDTKPPASTTSETPTSSSRSKKNKPKPQLHTYHDYATIPDSSSFVRKKTGGVTTPFPEKLMEMLDAESIVNPAIVSWLPHGRAFIVRKPKLFTSEIMLNYFRQSKLTSFQRQLNLYGFRRITQGADAGAYYHELFLRGRPQLCMRMIRQKVKGTGHKQPTDVSSEPNFYGMGPVGPEGNVGSSSGFGWAAGGNGPSVGDISADMESLPPPSLPPLSSSAAVPATTSYTTYNNAQQTTPQVHQQLTNIATASSVFSPSSMSPGIRAATVLKRLSSIGNVSMPFSLGESALPPSTGPRNVTDNSTTYFTEHQLHHHGDSSALHGFQAPSSSLPGPPPLFAYDPTGTATCATTAAAATMAAMATTPSRRGSTATTNDNGATSEGPSMVTEL